MDAATFYGSPEHQTFTLGEGSKKAFLLHGFPGTPAELRAVATLLRSRGWQATAPLLPGFGIDIPNLGEKRWQNWRDAALTHWQTLTEDASQTLLLGFSMGGALALHLAAARPPDTLVLIAPFWRMNDPRTRFLPLIKYVMPTLRPFKKADFNDRDVRRRFERMLPDVDLDNPNVQTRLRQEVVLPTSSVDELRKLGRAAYRVAAQVDAPVLAVQGFQDATVTPYDTRRLLSRLRGRITLHEIDGDHEVIKPHGRGHDALLDLLRSAV